MSICQKAGIPWGSFHVSRWPHLRDSPWYSTLTARQKLSICFNMAQKPEHHIVFREIQQTLGRGRSARYNNDGIVIVGTEMPNGITMTFHNRNDPPRLVLGREGLLLQGFPIDVLDAECFTKDGKRIYSETLFQDLAGNMVSTFHTSDAGDSNSNHGRGKLD